MRALAYLATKPPRKITMISEIGEATKVPLPYIAKIFQSLVKNEILVSRRGPAGGFALKKAPGKLSLLEIVRAVDDIEELSECVMGLAACSPSNACPLHAVWSQTKEKMMETLERCSLTEMMQQTGDRKYRPYQRAKLQLSF